MNRERPKSVSLMRGRGEEGRGDWKGFVVNRMSMCEC